MKTTASLLLFAAALSLLSAATVSAEPPASVQLIPLLPGKKLLSVSDDPEAGRARVNKALGAAAEAAQLAAQQADQQISTLTQVDSASFRHGGVRSDLAPTSGSSRVVVLAPRRGGHSSVTSVRATDALKVNTLRITQPIR